MTSTRAGDTLPARVEHHRPTTTRRNPMDKPLTEPQRLMLEALYDATVGAGREYAWPAQLARLRWPDSPGWTKRTRRYGTNANGAVGGTMPMKAATILWRLHARGLATLTSSTSNHWTPTAAGVRLVQEARRGA